MNYFALSSLFDLKIEEFAINKPFLRWFLNSKEPLPAARGRLFEYRSIPVIVTYDPQTVLNESGLRRPVWEDLKTVRRLLNNRLIND